MTKPTILALVTFFPWPADHGDAVRRLHMLRCLDALGDVTAVCICRPNTREDEVNELRKNLRHTHVVALPNRFADPANASAKLARTLSGMASGNPPWLYQQATSATSKLEGIRDRRVFDYEIAVGEPAALYLSPNPQDERLRVWDKSNVLSASELTAIFGRLPLGQKARQLATWPLTYSFERRSLRRTDRIWVTSSEESARLAKIFRRKADAVIPSVVDKAPGIAFSPDSRSVLWLGTLSYAPNWHGLMRFLEVNSAFLQQANLRLRVVGAGATSKQRNRLARYGCVDFVGYAPDLLQASRGVRAGVVPVWEGAGVKLKTLTMMSMGLPIATTTVGMEGIPHHGALAVEDEPSTLALRVANADINELTRSGERASRLVEEKFSVASLAAEMAQGLGLR